MSLKTIPGFGKSGDVDDQASSASRRRPAPSGIVTSCRAWTAAAGSAAAGRADLLGLHRPRAARGATRPLPEASGRAAAAPVGRRRLRSAVVVGGRRPGSGRRPDRHVVGERRHVGVAVGLRPTPGLGRRFSAASTSFSPRLQLHQQRGGDEDRGVGTGGHADEQRQREVLERARAELHGADVQDRADREQRHDRGVDRPHQGLVDREVGGLGVGLCGSARRSLVFSRTLSKTTTVS